MTHSRASRFWKVADIDGHSTLQRHLQYRDRQCHIVQICRLQEKGLEDARLHAGDSEEWSKPTNFLFCQLGKSSRSIRSLAFASLWLDDFVLDVGDRPLSSPLQRSTSSSCVCFIDIRVPISCSFFEAFNIAIQISDWRLMQKQKNTPLDLSAKTASYMFLTSIPRNLPPLALLLIFGTTRVFRARLYRAFWPKRWQRFDELTPLETPYQSAEAGRQWHSRGAPKIDLKLTTASLRWNHGDKMFAAWESRVLDARETLGSNAEERQGSMADFVEKSGGEAAHVC